MRDRDRQILALGLPIIGGMVSQNVLNLVDLAMVGTLGDAAVAAVGLGSFANFMATAFITGVSPGVQAMAARRLGQGRLSELAAGLNGALLLVLIIGSVASLVLVGVVPDVFPFLNPDPAVVDAGVPYLQARLWALVAVGMNFSFRGYWNGVNLSKLYMRTLLFMHACNIFFNWVLIFGNLGAPAMGATGAGIASAIATYAGTAFYFVQGSMHARQGGFLRQMPGRETFQTIARLAIPAGIQQVSFATGYTALFWIIGHIDLGGGELATAEVAAANALINVMLVAMLPGMALGMVAASLVGQALGRDDVEDARRWAWDVARVGLVVVCSLGLPMFLFPDLILAPFLHEPSTLAIARAPLRLVGATIGFDAITSVFMQSLQGAGASRLAMIVSIALQWGIFLPVAFLLGPVLGYGLLSIWIAMVAYRALTALAFGTLWMRGSWSRIRV